MATGPKRDNRLTCTLIKVLPLCEMIVRTLVPAVLTGQRLKLNLAAALLRQLGGVRSSRLAWQVPPEAVDIMPVLGHQRD